MYLIVPSSPSSCSYFIPNISKLQFEYWQKRNLAALRLCYACIVLVLCMRCASGMHVCVVLALVLTLRLHYHSTVQYIVAL